MKVTVFGASGNVGQLVVKELLSAGHTVTAFVHSSKLMNDAANYRQISGDIHDKAAVEAALDGSEAVISALGSWHTPTKDILSAAMQNILPAMRKIGIRRIVTLTGSGAQMPDETLSLSGKVAHRMFATVAPKIIDDAEKHLRLLNDSDLDWTSLRSPVMRNGPTEKYTLNQTMPKAWETVTRTAVARALVDQLSSNDGYRQAPQIHMR